MFLTTTIIQAFSPGISLPHFIINPKLALKEKKHAGKEV